MFIIGINCIKQDYKAPVAQLDRAYDYGSQLINYSKESISKFFKELQDKGFIKVNQRGSFKYKKRHASTWYLTMEEDKQGNKTRCFKHWNYNQSKKK